MMTNKVNEKHKDSLFRIIFGEYEENALSLYNAINGTDYDNVEDLTMTTIKGALYIGIKNDVSFLFDDSINLYEAQSTFNPNMPLRGLAYFSQLHSDHIDIVMNNRSGIYKSTLLKVPTPKYYVFYNGKQDCPEKMILRFSDAYDGDGDLEITAHMLNINYGRNNDLMERCEPLRGYAMLISHIRENKKQGMDNETAVEKAIDNCIKDGILVDLLKKERNRMLSPLLTGLTEEEKEQLHRAEAEEAKKQGREEGREEGLEQGREEGDRARQITIAQKMKAKNYPTDEIADITGLSIEEIKNL